MSLAIVQQVKAELEAAGVNLSGACGAFAIVQRVAWRLRDQGYGLLGGKSPGQNGCTVGSERYSVDWILKADGNGVDILRNAGGNVNDPAEPANVPTWNEDHADPALYRPAIDPGDAPAPPPPVPEPDPGEPEPCDCDDLRQIINDMIVTMEALRIRIQILEDAPPPPVDLPPLEAVGRTSRGWGHTHEVILDVRRKG
jgi:hypothetical protein